MYEIVIGFVILVGLLLFWLAKRQKDKQRQLEHQVKDLQEEQRQRVEAQIRATQLARDQPVIQYTDNPRDSNVNQLQTAEPEPIHVPANKATRVDDSKLKRVSVSTNSILFSKVNFEVDSVVKELFYALKSKYRLFFITQVDKEDDEKHKMAKECLDSMIDAGVVQSHRVMYCTTEKGKEAMVRQLGAELHIESNIGLI